MQQQNSNQQHKSQKPSAVDEYKGLKKESVVVVLTDKDGKQTKVKI
jgi:hypothetical protein